MGATQPQLKQQAFHTHRIHGAAIYGNMDPINIPPMLAYIYHTWILWVMNGGLFVCILCVLMIPSLDVSIPCVEKAITGG